MATEISDWNDLDNVRNDLTADYVLVNDLDSETGGYAGVGDDFEPIGDEGSFDGMGVPFEGTFNGDGFAIEDLVIDFQERGVGLFGDVDNTDALIEDLSVLGSVSNADADEIRTGGLVGILKDGTIQNCVSHVDVTASNGDQVGGLAGSINGIVSDSYATGSVEGVDEVGGLAGSLNDTITNCYATGSVDGDSEVGGLVGQIQEFGGGEIQKSYAVGLVTGNTDVGGLVGARNGETVIDSYWDTESTGQDTSDGGTGLTTAEMQGSEAETNMDGFDFENVWSIVEPETIETDTINGQITLDNVAAETATVILHNFSEPESIVAALEDGYPILLSVDKKEQLDSQNVESQAQANIARTQTDTNGNYSADIPGTTGDTIAVAVDFDDGTDRYGRLITTVLE